MTRYFSPGRSLLDPTTWSPHDLGDREGCDCPECRIEDDGQGEDQAAPIVPLVELNDDPTCVYCGRPYQHGCNSDFCNSDCEDAWHQDQAGALTE